MYRLLVYSEAHRRLNARMSSAAGVEWLVFETPERLWIDGRPISPKDARPDAAWFSVEAYRTPRRAAFLDFLVAQPSLGWVHLSGAAIHDPQFRILFRRGVKVTTHHGHAAAVAEFVLAGVLEHFQRGPQRREIAASRSWRSTPARELAGSSWLILGLGAIGEAVAIRARAFGASIAAVRRTAA